tara:strand:+ start:1123 stop:1851 length:729 start_codon:yes stop_codon:yes gene_type:complete
MIFLIKYYTAFCLSFFRKKKSNNFILMYHKILISKIYNDIFAISFKSFTNQILFLKNRFNIVNLNYIDKKENSFSVTFDDGYDDLYYLVFPFIKKYKINITIFMTLNNLNKNGYLTFYHLKEMLESGLVELGCHGNSHVSLKNVDSKILYDEIAYPKKHLENLFDLKIYFISFPNGKYDIKTIKYCKDLGFKKTFNSELKTFDIIDNLYLFPRICVYRYDTVKILLNKVVGKFDFLNINPND